MAGSGKRTTDSAGKGRFFSPTMLVNCTDASDRVIEEPDGTTASSASLSPGGVAGVTIAAIVFVALVCGLLYYAIYVRPTSTKVVPANTITGGDTGAVQLTVATPAGGAGAAASAPAGGQQTVADPDPEGKFA